MSKRGSMPRDLEVEQHQTSTCPHGASFLVFSGPLSNRVKVRFRLEKVGPNHEQFPSALARRRRLLSGAALLILACIVMGCGGSSSGGGTVGTPSGSYAAVLTASDGKYATRQTFNVTVK